ncbi:MAG: hypothetical protein EZS28_016604, partial [Streblomastix strix]
MINRQ